MSTSLTAWVEGIGVWAPELPNWPALRTRLRGQDTPGEASPSKPPAQRLSPGERRRASPSVRLAIEAATQAVEMSGRAADSLPSVFACAHGDAAIMDYMCATLAETPLELSPTRFHNSVHNAAAGYWTIATGCMQASTAVSASDYSFGAGLLEAMVHARAESRAVLLVASDAPGSGPLAEMIATRTPFGCALVLAPDRGHAACARLDLQLHNSHAAQSPQNRELARLSNENTCGDGLVLLEALATQAGSTVRIASGPGSTLHVETEILT